MRVLLAVDETEASGRAARFVEEFFVGMEDVTIRAVNVAEAPIPWAAPAQYGWLAPVAYGSVYGWPWGSRADDVELVEDSITRDERRGEAVARAQAPFGAEVEVRVGDVADAIAGAAVEQDADLIVVGSNHKGFVHRLIEPSVSLALARQAPVPVLVVA